LATTPIEVNQLCGISTAVLRQSRRNVPGDRAWPRFNLTPGVKLRGFGPLTPLVANSGHGGRPDVSEHGSGRWKARKPCRSQWRCCTSLLYISILRTERPDLPRGPAVNPIRGAWSESEQTMKGRST
jgi:hypothetical protein